MSEFKITKVSIKNVEGSNMLYISLNVEHENVELDMSRILNKNNANDDELLKAIQSYTYKEVESLITLHKKHSL